MLRLNRTDTCPPDGFRYTHPESRFTTKAIDVWTWMQKIREHRKANNLPPITQAEAEDQLCQQIPPQNCHQEGPVNASVNVNTRLRWVDVLAGTRAYMALLTGNLQMVAQGEADRRARICSGCYFRTVPQGCGSCVKIGRLITGDIAQKQTPYDDNLVNRACAVCSCPVASLVHFPMEALSRTDTPEKQSAYPEFCWRKAGGANRVE